MKYLLILFLLFSFTVGAQQVNEKYSYKDFLNQSLKSEPVEDFNNTTIIGSCFYQEALYEDIVVQKDIFPDGMTGVTFIRCNLDNVLIPVGNLVAESCTKKKYKVQNDLEDWELDELNQPKEPKNKAKFEEYGISTKPKDIPIEKVTKRLIKEKEKEDKIKKKTEVVE